jgi:alkylation response protein AidB-like acyl-CoA dehydrogenase
MNMALLPMSKAVLENTWKVTGMKGTGSDTLVAKDIAIGKDQFCQITSASVGVALDQSTYTKEASDYWVGFPLLRAKALGVLLGAAEGLLESVIEIKDRPIIYSTYQKRVDSQVWQAGIGEAAARIGVARSIVDKHNIYNDEAASHRHILSYAERAVCRGECGVAADLLIKTVEDLMDLSGSSAFATKCISQRYWRDFSIGIRHIIFNSKMGYEVFGRQILGVEPNVVASDHV